MDSTGRITGYKTQAGADTVFPFSVLTHGTTTMPGQGARKTITLDFVPSKVFVVGGTARKCFIAAFYDSTNNFNTECYYGGGSWNYLVSTNITVSGKSFSFGNNVEQAAATLLTGTAVHYWASA